MTFADGMEELIRALAVRLPSEAIRLKARVTEVARGTPAGGWPRGTARGDADAVIIATESHQAGRMLRYADPGLAHLLDGIPYASSATVTLGWRRADIRASARRLRLRRAAGRAPSHHRVHLLEREVPGPRARRLCPAPRLPGRRAERGGPRRSDETLAAIARAELGALLGVGGAPLLDARRRYPKAMPQYHVGHLARVEAIERCVARHPGLALVGGAYRGVGHRRLRALGRGRRRGCSSAQARRYARDSSASSGRWTSSTASRYRNGNGLVT